MFRTFRAIVEMLALSALKKLLLVLRYPSFAKVSGPYRVGAIQTRLPSRIGTGTVQCQICYPCAGDAPSNVPYFRPSAARGVADYSRIDPDLMSVVLSTREVGRGALPMEGKNEWPLVVFSHGLGGCMEMYSQLAIQLASKGCVVVAMEHEDGSGSYAETKRGKPILYKRPDDSPYSREKVLKFRRPFLEQRVEETLQVIEAIKSCKKDETGDEVLDSVMRMVDEKKIHFVGHSFGGATLVLVAQKLEQSKYIVLTRWLECT